MKTLTNIRTFIICAWIVFGCIFSHSAFAAAPVIVSPYNNEVIAINWDTVYPTIAWTADSGATITAKKDGSPVCTTVADSSGQWSCTSTVWFAPGVYPLTATSVLWGTTEQSASISCVIIVRTLEIPKIISPYNNEVLYTTGANVYPTITGTATPDSTIVVKKNGTPVCTTTTNSSGQWSCVSLVWFAPGAHPLVATSTLGDQSKDSPGISCVIITFIDISAVTEALTGSVVGATGSVDISTNDTKPTSSTYTYIPTGSTCSLAWVSETGIANYTVPAAGASCTVNYRVCAPAPNTAVCSNATLTVYWPAPIVPPPVPTVSAVSEALTGSVVGATGSVDISTNDTKPTSSTYTYIPTGSTCSLAWVSETGIANYTVPAAGASCTVNYRVCAPAPNTAVCSNATLTVYWPAPIVPPPVPTVSAVSEALTGSVVGATGSVDISTNDTKPTSSTYTYIPTGSTCSLAWVSETGIANYTVPAAGASCTVNYRVCAPAPNTAVCSNATLTVYWPAPIVPPPVPTVSAVSEALTGSVVGATGSVDISTNDTKPTSSTYTYIPTGSTCSLAWVSETGIANYTVPAAGASCTVNYRVCAPAPNTAVCSNATLTVYWPAPIVPPPTHITPVFTEKSPITLSCGQTSTLTSFTWIGSSGATIRIKALSGTILGSTIVGANGIWTITPSVSFPVGTTTISLDSTIWNTTIIGNNLSFTVIAASGCNSWGGGSTTWPGGGSPSPVINGTTYISTTPLYPIARPVIINPAPARPLARYEIARTLERKSLNVRPYWQRFPTVKTPTKTFLGTGPKSLNERTYIVTSKRVQTGDDFQTKKAQSKKTFPYPLLGN